MNANTTACVITRTIGGTDPFGNPTFVESYDYQPGVFWPAGSTEARDGQDQVSWQTTVCLPDSVDVSAIDAVVPQVVLGSDGQPALDGDGRPQGVRYEVDGQPTVWPTTPWGWRPDFPVQITLGRETG